MPQSRLIPLPPSGRQLTINRVRSYDDPYKAIGVSCLRKVLIPRRTAMLFIGIDWADEHHDLVLTDETDTSVEGYRERLRLPHTVEGFAQLHALVQRYETDPTQVLVA